MIFNFLLHFYLLRVISGFHRDVDKIWVLPGFYAT